MWIESTSFPDKQSPPPYIDTRWVSGGDSAINLIRAGGFSAGSIFRCQRHSTSPETSAGLAYIRNQKPVPELEAEIGHHMEKSVWRPANDVGGLLVCRPLSEKSMIITAVQADTVAQVTLLVTTDATFSLPEVPEGIVISPEQFLPFRYLPVCMRRDWANKKFDFACSTTPQAAIRQEPKFFDFQDGVTGDVEEILTEIAVYHPDSHLF